MERDNGQMRQYYNVCHLKDDNVDFKMYIRMKAAFGD